jgi:hypothetical protein
MFFRVFTPNSSLSGYTTDLPIVDETMATDLHNIGILSDFLLGGARIFRLHPFLISDSPFSFDCISFLLPICGPPRLGFRIRASDMVNRLILTNNKRFFHVEGVGC